MSYVVDITGQRFGRLVVMAYSHSSYWHCECDCGNRRTVFSGSLKSGATRSCGCLRQETTRRRARDLHGQRFDRLVVIEEAPRKGYARFWRCQCDCGQVTVTSQGNLTSGATASCGCKLREAQRSAAQHAITTHGLSKHPLYPTWRHMMERCYNVNNPGYKNYGGRGIAVCERWHNIAQFIQDMGNRPPKTTIERLNNDGNYEPQNCIWATQTAQVRNRRNTTTVTYQGVTKPLATFCQEHGVPYKVVHDRLYRYHWSLERALTTSVA